MRIGLTSRPELSERTFSTSNPLCAVEPDPSVSLEEDATAARSGTEDSEHLLYEKFAAVYPSLTGSWPSTRWKIFGSALSPKQC